MSHQKSIDYKETAVQYYLVEDMTQKEVCKIFKCSPRSLTCRVNKYKKDGETTGYRIPKHTKFIKTCSVFTTRNQKNKTITIDDLLHLLKNKYPTLHLNKSHIHRNKIISK